METVEGFPIRQSCISLSKSYSRGAIRKSYVATPIFAKKGGNGGGVIKGQGSNASNGKAAKGTTVGKAGKVEATSKGKAKAKKGRGDGGGWPSTTGKPSGGGRSNKAAKSDDSVKKIQRLTQEKNALAKKVQTLEKEKSSLEQTLRFSKSAFDGTYKHYKRESVRELSQLISCYLLDKPHQIDGEKIYGRVHSCYHYLEEDYDDNPECYDEDMRMLLATCLASRTWFSNNQYDNIEGWHDRIFGDG
ncbi:hypothetical protein ACHAWC_001068 [Mediolabrus comicus]